MEQHRDRGEGCAFDVKAARETAESFSAACGVSCAVLNREGETLFAARAAARLPVSMRWSAQGYAVLRWMLLQLLLKKQSKWPRDNVIKIA